MRRRELHGMRPLAVLLALSASCASVDPRPDYDAAAEAIRATTGSDAVFDPEVPVLTPEELHAAVADGLGLEEATRLALLENRRLQAGFLELGVARADYVQSGLVRNPSLSFALLFPEGGGRARWTADLVGSLSDLWEIPLRQKSAAERIDRQVLDLARFAGELVLATRAAYFETVAAREIVVLAREDAELARRSRAAVDRQVQEGIATKTEESLAETLVLAADLARTRAEGDAVGTARELATLLSLREDLLLVPLTDRLPVPAGGTPATEVLVEQGLRSRLDLRAFEREIAAAETQVALERRRAMPEIGVGLSAERPEGGGSTDLLVGPGATIELPIFDQNQAQRSRAEFRLAALRKEREALVAAVTQEVRAAADMAGIARRAAVFARDELVPQAERGAALAARAYELGDALLLTTLQSQRAWIGARRTALDALLEAARTELELEKVLAYGVR